jgi:hypothetical protein
LLVDFGSFHSRVDNVINDSFNYSVTRHRWNGQELSRALIHVLAHFQRTCSQIYFRFSSYLLRKPHLFLILTAIGWFIVNIQSDLFWHWCLERQAFGTPRMYTLSPSKSIKGSNYREFLKDKNVLLCTRLYKYAPNLESLLTQQYVCVMCTLWSDNTCVFTRFHSVKNANTQLIWSSVNLYIKAHFQWFFLFNWCLLQERDRSICLRKQKFVVFIASRCYQYVINFRKIGVHVRKPVDHLVTTSARRTFRTQAMNTFPSYS